MEIKEGSIVIAPVDAIDNQGKYFTKDKEYEVLGVVPPFGFEIRDDVGDIDFCISEIGCGHLKGKNWIIKKD